MSLADFIEKKQIGITVESLLELNNIDLRQNYEVMRRNVMKIKNYIALKIIIKLYNYFVKIMIIKLIYPLDELLLKIYS